MTEGTWQAVAPGKRRYVLHPRNWRDLAFNLQRKGLTLSEISVELDVPRDDVVRVLYWEAVQ